MTLPRQAPSLMLALLIVIISIPMLASCPQGGDGAEMLNTALWGGVLHPPGFPLQSWLNRLFIHLPLNNPVIRLSLLSLLAHGATAFLIAEGLRVSGVRAAACLFGGLAYAFYPSPWYSGLQPEVFSIAHLCIAAAITQGLSYVSKPASSLNLKNGVAIALLGGLSLSQSPITVTAAPAFLLSLAWVLKAHSNHRFKLSFVCTFVFLGTITAMYASLPLLRTSSPWPDWGKLSSFSSILNHFLRRDFGTFSLLPVKSLSGKTQLTGFSVFFQETQNTWHLFSLFLLVGLGSGFWISKRKIPIGLVFLCLLSSSLFLQIAVAESQDVFYKTMLERFIGTAVIPAAYLMGFGFDFLYHQTPLKRRAAMSLLGVIVFAAFIAIPSYRIADASKDCTLDVIRSAIALEVPPHALYISAQSEEYFYGIQQGSSLRFPLMRGQFFEYPWYRQEVLPALETRFAGTEIDNLDQLKESARTHRIDTIVSLDPHLFKLFKTVPELRGILYYSDPSTLQLHSERTLTSALKLCPLISRLEGLPAHHHGYSHQLRRFLARGFHGAAVYLESIQKKEEAFEAYQIFESLLTSPDSTPWKKGCTQLISKLQKQRGD